MTDTTSWTREPTAGELALTGNATEDGQPRCNAALPDPAGSELLVRCSRMASDHGRGPVYVDSQTPVDDAHAGEDALGSDFHWWDSAPGARAHYEPKASGRNDTDHLGHAHKHRTFQLYRRVDVTGVSGTGVVAEGCQFTDGRVVLRWIGGKGSASTACWDSLADALEVHGHDGATTVEWT